MNAHMNQMNLFENVCLGRPPDSINSILTMIEATSRPPTIYEY